jgi:hypothetical protein
MKILFALRSGIMRSIKVWKGVAIIWLVYLAFVSILAIPMKGAFSSALGTSMVTERFANGLNLEMFTDMNGAFRSILVFFRNGLMFMLLLNVILGAFLTGGLFRVLSLRSFSSADFWKGASVNFWSYLVISLIFSLVILILFFGIVILPVSYMISAGDIPDHTIMKTGIALVAGFFILLAILLAAADYARAWQSGIERNRCFAAIGFGFGKAFRAFFSSWGVMMVVLIIQSLFLMLASKFLAGSIPSTGATVFMFFVVSQLLFFIRLMIRSFRYGSIISLLE